MLPVWALPGMAWADAIQTLRETVVNVEAPVAIPLSEPLRDHFGVGTMPAVSASLPVGGWTHAGAAPARWLSLQWSCACGSHHSRSWNGRPGRCCLPSADFVLWQGASVIRAALGPWIELGVGPGLTGTLVRAVGEAAVGWNFRWREMDLRPLSPLSACGTDSNSLDNSDAQLALLGVEIVMHDSHWPAPVVAPPGRGGRGRPRFSIGTAMESLTTWTSVPNEPEDFDGFEDEDGCPDPDNDKDGIPDVVDKCPNEPETVNGVDDEDGCPDEAPIVVREDRILLTEHVLFDTNRARVRSAGRPALAAVLNLWKQHPEWDHLVIEGHANRRGPDPFNDWLSHERAERARKVIIEMGFPAEKLVVAAFGNKQLRVQGTGEEADRENRRVEFVIIKKVEERAKGPDPFQPPKGPDPTQPPPAQPQIGRLQP